MPFNEINTLKALVSKEGHTLFFRKGQPITGWFDEKGYPDEIVDVLHEERQIPCFVERVNLIYHIKIWLFPDLRIRSPLYLSKCHQKW